MIIDLISERRVDIDHNVYEYDARRFFDRLMNEWKTKGTEYAYKIACEMGFGTEDDVKVALCKYIDKNEYNPAIKDFINSVTWIVSDNYDRVEAC